MHPDNVSATPISGSNPGSFVAGMWIIVVLGFTLDTLATAAVGAPSTTKPTAVPLATFSAQFADAAQAKLLAARRVWQADTNNMAFAWALGRACFWRGEFAVTDEERAALAQEGIAVCRTVTARAPTLPEGHYYLAMNLGQLARTKWLEALGLVRELESSLKLASGMNPRLDHAGPDRCLGQLYRDAPGWPVSLGSKSKARTHLMRAVELAPEFPENHLALVETWLMWKDKKALQRDLKPLPAVMAKARQLFTGDDWAAHWDDWDRRWKEVQLGADELYGRK